MEEVCGFVEGGYCHVGLETRNKKRMRMTGGLGARLVVLEERLEDGGRRMDRR